MNTFKIIVRKTTKMLVAVSLSAAFTIAAQAAGLYYPGASATVINSSVGPINYTTLATNGYYSAAIAGATGTPLTETNLVCLNPNNAVGNTIALQFTSGVLTNGVALAATNVQFLVTEANANANIPIVANAFGAQSSTWPRSGFAIVTLNLVGATTNQLYTTNVVFTPETTPAFAAGVKLFVEQITPAIAAGSYLTNYSVTTSQN